jgi:hypothetical protein
MAVMRTAPHRQSTAVDDSLRAEAPPETDQCGQCGVFYIVTRDSVYGACSVHDGLGRSIRHTD